MSVEVGSVGGGSSGGEHQAEGGQRAQAAGTKLTQQTQGYPFDMQCLFCAHVTNQQQASTLPSSPAATSPACHLVQAQIGRRAVPPAHRL